MASIVKSFKDLLVVNYSVSYSNVLLVHYPLSFALVMMNVMIATAMFCFGDRIGCSGGHPIFSQKMIENHCYVNPKLLIPFGHKTISHRHPIYYQWVIFIFVFQATIFYIPKWILDLLDNGDITKLIRERPSLANSEALDKYCNGMAKSIYHTRHHYWPILLGYYLSHFIAIGLIFMQIYFMNNLLDDQFWTQGFSIFETFLESPVTRSDSLSLLFPYTIKCLLESYSPSGDLQKHFFMCHLNQNNLYEKALILMWFWFVSVFFVTCLWTIFKIIGISTQKIRFSYLKVNDIDFTTLDKIFYGLTWFQSLGFHICLHQFKQNLDVATYCSFIMELEKISVKSDENSNSDIVNESQNSSVLSGSRVA